MNNTEGVESMSTYLQYKVRRLARQGQYDDALRYMHQCYASGAMGFKQFKLCLNEIEICRRGWNKPAR